MKSKPMRSKFIRSVLGTLLPTLLGLLLLLMVPLWNMGQDEALHRRIENQVVPAREKVQRTLVLSQRLSGNVSDYIQTMDKRFLQNYQVVQRNWLKTVQSAGVEELHDPNAAMMWSEGVADVQVWQRDMSAHNLPEASSMDHPVGSDSFQRGIRQMESVERSLDQMEQDLRARVHKSEQDAIAMTTGLGIICALLVLLSWRNAVALHRALDQASQNADRLQVAVKETNHRVKNNLQTIGALIDMNRQDYGEQIPRRILDDIYQQVLTVAAVHDFLSHEHQANQVAIRPMLEKLVKLTASAKELSARVEAEAIDLPVKEATSAALIANELVLNAGKHGAKCIHVHFTVREGQCALRVCDDGPGLPPDFSVAKNGNLGTTLIETLVQHDLGGTVQWVNGPDLGGAEIVIVFPLPEADA